MSTTVDDWRNTARKVRIASADVELTAGAFQAHEEFRNPKDGV